VIAVDPFAATVSKLVETCLNLSTFASTKLTTGTWYFALTSTQMGRSSIWQGYAGLQSDALVTRIVELQDDRVSVLSGILQPLAKYMIDGDLESAHPLLLSALLFGTEGLRC
jgi:hypothetical protein